MSQSEIAITEPLKIGENDHGYWFGIGRLGERWAGFAVGALEDPIRPTFDEAQSSLKGTECICGRKKEAGTSVCWNCYQNLPRSLRHELYRPPVAYHRTLGQALEHLRAVASRAVLTQSGLMTQEEVDNL